MKIRKVLIFALLFLGIANMSNAMRHFTLAEGEGTRIANLFEYHSRSYATEVEVREALREQIRLYRESIRHPEPYTNIPDDIIGKISHCIFRDALLNRIFYTMCHNERTREGWLDGNGITIRDYNFELWYIQIRALAPNTSDPNFKIAEVTIRGDGDNAWSRVSKAWYKQCPPSRRYE